MKTLLITTSFEDSHRNSAVQDNSHYPLGLAYLHSYLEQYNHEVETLFLNDYPYENCFNIIKQKLELFQADVIGFNILTPNRISSFEIIEYVYDIKKDVKIVIGGIHTTLMYQQILKKYPFLIAVLGEGEETIRELMDKFSKKESISSVNGIAYINNGKVVKTENRKLIENLDKLPFPKHEIFFSQNRTLGNLLTSRGCPFKCSFCVLDSISQQNVRYRSSKNVVDEIEYMVKKFPQLTTIWIHDDNFFLKNDRAIEICNDIVRRGIKKKFICSGRFKPFTKELADALEKAGFMHILFGLESGSKKILDTCHKKILREDVVKTMKVLKNSKIEVTTFLIIGLYGENDDTIRETIRFVKSIQKIKYIYFDEIGVILTYPGTEIYDIAKKHGLIDDSYWLTGQQTPIFTVEHSIEKLLNYKKRVINSIAFKKIFSLSGFIHQFDMIPAIIKYAINGSYFSKGTIYNAILQISPKFIKAILSYMKKSLVRSKTFK